MKKVIYAVLGFSPVLALAQGNFANLNTLVANIGQLINKIIPVLFAVALVYFFWGVIKYIRSAGDPKEADAGKSIMIYGIIGLAVMVSVYGLINFLTNSAGLDNTPIVIPKVPLQ